LIAIPASAKKPKSGVNVVNTPTVQIVNAGFAAPVPDQLTFEGKGKTGQSQ